MKPPFAYFGGKQRIADEIVARFVEHEHYIEPYAGGLSVLLAKRPSKMETINDLDQDIMTFWRVLRDQPTELERVCALTPHSRAESLEARDRENVEDLERARRVWVALTQRRAGQLQRTGWRYNVDPGGSTFSLGKYLSAYAQRIAPAAERLRNVSLECRPAIEIIDLYGKFDRALLYVDPPYLGSTRGDSHPYRHEMRDEASHRELAEALSECSAAVVLSGYHSPLYDDLYSTWYRDEIASFTGQGSVAGPRTEVLWSNRPFPEGDLMLELYPVATVPNRAGSPSNSKDLRVDESDPNPEGLQP